jgi:hypothetical protein
LQEQRSSWQSWHVCAEAQRQVRAVQVSTDKVEQLVELLVAEVLHTRSISLTASDENITEPGALRRVDGSNVYSVAGSDLFTSPRILAAEQRLVTTAGRSDGGHWTSAWWSWRCWNQPRTGPLWMLGRPLWFVPCAPFGARLQLAIAHTGAGKTTAMRTLVQVWRDGGGQVLGLRPSAAAAARLRDATGAHRPRRWRSSTGPSITLTCPTGRNASAGPHW